MTVGCVLLVIATKCTKEVPQIKIKPLKNCVSPDPLPRQLKKRQR